MINSSSLLFGRTLPPAGPPLPLESILKSLLATDKNDIYQCLHSEITQYFKVKNAVFTDSGRSGLALSLLALQNCLDDEEKKKKVEVLIPAYVSYSVPSAVVHAGFKIRLYDIDQNTLEPDYASMQSACSEKTLAIVICHQFGLVFDATLAKKIADENNTFLIDDAAQAMGGMFDGNFAGTMGDVGLFSLSRGKPLTAVEGGIVLTNSPEINESLQVVSKELYASSTPSKKQLIVQDLKNIIKSFALYFLRRPTLYSIPASMPFLNIGASIFEPNFFDGAMSPYRMRLCSQNLPLLENANSLRRKWGERYTYIFEKQDNLRTIAQAKNSKNIFLRYPLLPKLGSEKKFQSILTHNNGLSAKKLGISRGFPLALYAVKELQDYLIQTKNSDISFAGAKYLAENLITLPTHDQVSESDFESITHLLGAL